MRRLRVSLLLAGLVLVVSASYSHAQYFPQHKWSQKFGSTGVDVARGMAVDGSNRIILVGSFEGSVDFGGGALTSAGDTDIFVACFTFAGTHLWSKRFGSDGPDTAYGVDDAYTVTGSFTGTVNFGGDDLASAGGSDGFVARFNASGNHVWSARFGDAGDDAGYGIAATSSGDAVTGSVTDTQIATTDMFVAEYDGTTGLQQWAHTYGGPLNDAGRSIAGRVVVGEFRDQGSFGGSSLVSAGGSDIFVAKYDNTGAHVWSERFGGSQDDAGLAVSSPITYCTGYFRGTVNFGAGNLTSAGGEDVFLLKLDSNGNLQFSRRYGGTGNDAGTSLSIDFAGNFVNQLLIDLVGRFENTVNFGSSSLTSAGGSDGFLSVLTDGAGYLYHPNLRNVRMGGSGDDSANAIGRLAYLYVPETKAYDVAIAGSFENTVDLGGGPLSSAGADDAFLVSYHETWLVPVLPGLPGNVLSISSYPNPFNPTTTVRYSVPSDGPVTVAIYSVRGERVATLVNNRHHVAGTHEVQWQGLSDSGEQVASGVYFAQVEHAGVQQTARMVMLK